MNLLLYYEGMLKWKSQEMTKANTIQAKRKFKNRWPFKQVRLSEEEDTCAGAALVAKSFISLVCCADSMSVGPTTLRAIELHISQVLEKITSNGYMAKKNQRWLQKTSAKRISSIDSKPSTYSNHLVFLRCNRDTSDVRPLPLHPPHAVQYFLES